jgi:hypothetical protein
MEKLGLLNDDIEVEVYRKKEETDNKTEL